MMVRATTTSKSPSIASNPQPTKTPLTKAQEELQKRLRNCKNELPQRKKEEKKKPLPRFPLGLQGETLDGSNPRHYGGCWTKTVDNDNTQ